MVKPAPSAMHLTNLIERALNELKRRDLDKSEAILTAALKYGRGK